jgi:hypothetical protein
MCACAAVWGGCGTRASVYTQAMIRLGLIRGHPSARHAWGFLGVRFFNSVSGVWCAGPDRLYTRAMLCYRVFFDDNSPNASRVS